MSKKSTKLQLPKPDKLLGVRPIYIRADFHEQFKLVCAAIGQNMGVTASLLIYEWLIDQEETNWSRNKTK